MAGSTARDGLLLTVVKSTFAEGMVLAAGRGTLGSAASVDVATGLSRVEFFVATQIGAIAATEAVVLQVDEDLPLNGGTVTVFGQTVDNGAATKSVSGEKFAWLAIGYR